MISWFRIILCLNIRPKLSVKLNVLVYKPIKTLLNPLRYELQFDH